MPATNEFVYDAANEALVLRAAIAMAQSEETEIRKQFRALIHSISADEFLVAQHSTLWRVLRQVSDKNLEYSPEIIRQLAIGEPTPLQEQHIEELECTAEVSSNIDWHVETLRWDATRARVMKGSLPDLVADLTDPRVTVERAVSSARAVTRALEGGGGRRFIRRPDEMSSVYKATLAKRREAGNFFPCGFSAIDDLMSEGFMPTKTAIITGLSGSGKSTFAARLAINLARLGRRPLMCAWEMGAASTLDLMCAMMTGIQLDTIVKGTYTGDELRRLEKACDWLNHRIRFMENAFFSQVASDTGRGKRERRSNDRNLDILEGYIAESGCDVVIMDLFDRLLADQSPDAVTDALYRQQNMHVEYNVHGTLLTQLRLKDVEKRPDKRPTRESIKGVGTFVEVPDLILGIHRDAQFKDVPDNTLEAICLKQRKGKLNWAVRFGWDGATCSITGGEQVPYNPGLESAYDDGDIVDPAAIRTKPVGSGPKPRQKRSRINYRG